MDNNWKKVYFWWKEYCKQIDSRIISEIKYMELYSSSRYLIGSQDWLPKVVIEREARNGQYPINWETITGVKRTAEMMWEHKDDDEKRALIWIGASLLEMYQNLPYEWRGETGRLIRNINGIVIKEMNDRNMWRWHATTKNALPNGLVKWTNIIQRPETFEELMEIVALECILSFNTYTLVNTESV